MKKEKNANKEKEEILDNKIEIKERKNSKIKLIIVLLTAAILVIGTASYFIITNKDKKKTDNRSSERKNNEIINSTVEHSLSSGDDISIDYFVYENAENYELIIKDVDGKTIELTTLYYDSEGKLVSKDSAINEDGILNDGYTSKNVILVPGEYEIIIVNKDTLEENVYNIIIEDKTAPTLVLNDDTLTIKVGDELNAKDLVSSCTDNSEEECIITIENIDEIDTSKEGTYKIIIVATDSNGNEVKDESSIKVNKKDESSGSSSKPKDTTSTSKPKDTSSSAPSSSDNSSSGKTSSSCDISKLLPWNGAHTTQKSCFSTTNKIAQYALAQVGQTGKSCSMVQMEALNKAGVITSVKAHKAWAIVGSNINNRSYDALMEKVNSDHTVTGHGTVTFNGETMFVKAIYHTKNNNIYKILYYDYETSAFIGEDTNNNSLNSKMYIAFTEFDDYLTTDELMYKVPLAQMKAGDILLYPGHIAVAIGNKAVVHGGWGKNSDVVISTAITTKTPTVYRIYDKWLP